MATTTRSETAQVDGHEVTIQIEPLQHPDYKFEIALIDTDEEPDEIWRYGITSDQDAEFLYSSEVDDLLAEPDPPEWVRRSFEQVDVEVASANDR
jgi:hypothetical protein